MQYRRARTPGGTYFFTVGTHGRRRFLGEPENVALLKAVFQTVMAAHPFLVDAMVVLPVNIAARGHWAHAMRPYDIIRHCCNSIAFRKPGG